MKRLVGVLERLLLFFVLTGRCDGNISSTGSSVDEGLLRGLYTYMKEINILKTIAMPCPVRVLSQGENNKHLRPRLVVQGGGGDAYCTD